MRILKRVRTFLRLNWESKMLLLEAYLQLARGRYLKSIPFSKVASGLGDEMKETSFSPTASNNAELARVSKAIHLMSRYTLWESQCLVKAIAGMKMLEKRNISSTLYLGTAKDTDGKMVAHAWLRSGPYYVSGAEVMDRFTVVAKFAKEMKH
ncbi:lasso peptide biosynthesis B2 protein [Sporosarcina thermotolerans]|uniref:Lasso peptide biosynthesis B2 protein n=1 Tax=Sporosarcina thermotolerans TaxID=633404 RepID=A0AAW9A7G2_9BACL|nr:lasso peptide biosynthesis B2 protein [Sporosarcina thermotolerans]MDW0116265.1 lasso peptide biosynthesis B2 protein [Sporosarcina thermotolerans]WHT48240.1 lasso peptide biosynthesis B2 protein [Sporosarcina thermotolerans]